MAVHPVRIAPKVHLFVCGNRREEGSPLGPGCGDAGDAVYHALKDEVTRHGAVVSVWVTRTHCLGVCPRHGATVAQYPAQRIWSDVTQDDVATLWSTAMEHA